MPVSSSGRIVKTRKGKGGTQHQKNHRWESFTSKISKLNSLDPIRRVRRNEADDGVSPTPSNEFSYFRKGVNKWQELNIYDGFISFSRAVEPLCDSLAQVVHHEEQIMELLVTYVEKKEKNSLQPLLELITDFAHDLGVRFEKHYQKALELVTSIATMRDDVEVIEWAFTCLAFLFKYLSKLLVPDLRPTYDLMAPLLGKTRQPPHIARFAAEAMSFLVKKAGTASHRGTALPLIVQHVKLDLESLAGTREFSLYYHGLMTLFAEAMKGNGMTVHTCGPAILRSLIQIFENDEIRSSYDSVWCQVIYGVLTSIIHHTRADTIKDVLETVLANISSSVEAFVASKSRHGLERLLLSSRLLGIVAGVRKGDRIADWSSILKAMSSVLQVITKTAHTIETFTGNVDLMSSIILSASIALQYAPMDSMIPHISSFMESLTKDPLAKWFFVFCLYFSETDQDKFRSIVLPYFQRFVVAHWSEDNGDSLCILLPKMVSSGVLPSNYGKKGFSLPQSWQDQIVSKFERLEVSPFPEQASPALYDRSPTTWHDRCLPKYNALLEVLECTSVHPSTNARIAEILLRKLKLALRPSSSLAPEEANFIVGRGFSAFSRMTRGASEADKALKPLLRAAAPRYSRLPKFLEALLDYEKSLKVSPKPLTGALPTLETADEADFLVKSLILNLSTSSHELRLISLRLLEHIHIVEYGASSEALNTMIIVEQTPLDIQTARSASMHIRKLGNLFSAHSSDSWIRQAIPAFCFGMLTVKFAQVWEDAIASLKLISASKEGEDIVATLSFGWLENPSMGFAGGSRNTDQPRSIGLTDFECSNLMRLDELKKESEQGVENCRDTMLQNFATAQELVPARPVMARAQSLRVLAAYPAMAERRSRQFVPMLLSWTSKVMAEDDNGEEGDLLSDWTRKDQKSQLEIFSLFTNSVSLYKSDEVYDAILQLLANGDIDIQKSALKAIFTWKRSSIKPYEENLLNLLDESRFKDEIAVLLQGKTLVQPEHNTELKPLLLRLLYGRAISRKGAASGKQGMEARRLTVLRNLRAEDVADFLGIALGDLKDVRVLEDGTVREDSFTKVILSTRRQVGAIHMIQAMVRELGTNIAPLSHKLMDAILYCTITSARQLKDDGEEIDEGISQQSQISLLKVIRQTGLKCLILLLANVTEVDWSPYFDVIDKELVMPRLEKLPIETAQGISGILRLLQTWSLTPNTVLFLGRNPLVLPKVAECILPAKSKDEVKLFALEIMKNVVKHSHEDATNSAIAKLSREQLLAPFMDSFLIHIGQVLRGHQDISKTLLESCVETVSSLSPFVTTSTQARNLVDVSVFLLDQPLKRVNPKTKGELLRILEIFVPLYDLQNDASLKEKVYNTITSLFGFFTDNPSRQVLSRVLMAFAKNDSVLRDVANICMGLNSFDATRLDSPDWEKRMAAFNSIHASRTIELNSRQWRPLLFNLLYYIKNTEEHGVLSLNSADGICRLIDTAGKCQIELERALFKDLLSSVLLPAVYSGAREPSEIVRREYAKVMAHLIRTFATWSEVSDMHCLLVVDDELESSFFNNILTVGKGKQSSALGLISSAAERGNLSAKNVSHFFIPLIEHFVFDRAEGNDAHSLAAEATTTIGVLAGALEWPQYRALLRRYIGYVTAKQHLEKQIIRLVGKVIDALALAAELQRISHRDLNTTGAALPKHTTLSETMPKEQKLTVDLTTNILPSLTAYLHGKDDSTVSLRVPIAIIIVRILKLLPQEQLNALLPPVLTDICHILKSKAQESRDMTRDTLTKICVLLGPSCFGFILKELRGALKRGSEIHVLSYTMHSLLVASTPEYGPGDLDYCLPAIVAIIMEDIFGTTGQEKDAEDYASKMKEVKSNKSHDSMELIARTATLTRLTDLVRPIQEELEKKMTLRRARKIDELLTRITNGLIRNDAAQSRDSLTFCYEVIQGSCSSSRNPLGQQTPNAQGPKQNRAFYTYKLIRFAFDVMRAVLKKYGHLQIASNTAAFLPMLGTAIDSGEEEVKLAAFRVLTDIMETYKVSEDGAIFKVTSDLKMVKPTEEAATFWTRLYRIAATEAIRLLCTSATSSESSQVYFRFVADVLRHRPDVKIKSTSIDKLMSTIRTQQHLTDPEHNRVVFQFLRSVLDAEYQTAVVYDTLEEVRNELVTNSDENTRNLARGAYFRFLSSYPQKQLRWKKQLKFIEDNLQYVHEGGRLSVMELIILLTKISNEHVQLVSESTFEPLVRVLAKDESTKCRERAGLVLREIFKKADTQHLTKYLVFMRSLIEDSKHPLETCIGFKVFGFYYEFHKDDTDLPFIQDVIIMTINAESYPDWSFRLKNAALQLTTILITTFPEIILASKDVWVAIQSCLSYHDQDVKASATLLINRYFADFLRTSSDNSIAESQSVTAKLPLRGSSGLNLTADDITDLIRRFVHVFNTPRLTPELAAEVVKNITFLACVAGEHDLKWRGKSSPDETDEEGEDDDDEQQVQKGSKSVLQFLFGRLSYILRKETIRKDIPGSLALVPKTCSLQLLSLLISELSIPALLTSLQTILRPLYNLTDSSIAPIYTTDVEFRDAQDALRSKAEELMEEIQKKIGTEEYTRAILEVRQGVKSKREGRRIKRRIEAVSMPERHGEVKRKKGERKKERRKEKGQEFAARRKEM